jgi:hypothetical protein
MLCHSPRKYVHDLATNVDPARIVAENVLLADKGHSLARFEELELSHD